MKPTPMSPRTKISICLFTALFLTFSHAIYSAGYYYELFALRADKKVDIVNSVAGSQLGATITTGDYNGDGIDDMAVSAPFASIGEREWNGQVYIYFGGTGFDNTSDLVITGSYSGDQLGTSLTTGDFNNDNIDDLIIGASNAKVNTARMGKVYGFYGRQVWTKTNIDLSIDKPSFSLNGRVSGDNFGLALTSGDLNLDGISDLAISAPMSRVSGLDDAGKVFVHFGSDKGIIETVDSILYGHFKGERFGSSLASGQLFGGSRHDLVISAYQSTVSGNAKAGRVYLYNGDLFPRNIIKSASYVLSSPYENDWYGFSIDIGDTNNDLYDDLAVSTFPYFGNRDNGRTEIYHGGFTFNNAPDMTIEGSEGETLVSSKILLEDINGDRVADILVGAPGIGNPISTNAGEVYLVYSDHFDSDGPVFSTAEGTVTSIIHGEYADDWFGYSLGVADLNNDGYKDIAVGARYADSSTSINNGKVHVFYGNNIPYGELIRLYDGEYVSRGELISEVVDGFDLRNTKASMIQSCYDYKDFCFFNFSAMSSFEGLTLEPEIILYPDVAPTSKYYEDTLVATILGLINGYLNEENSPFKPNLPTTRIQALKVVLTSADLVDSKYRFELIDELGSVEALTSQNTFFDDVDPSLDHMWWYPRYTNFAVENGILDDADFFYPDQRITPSELSEMINRTLEFIKTENEEIVPPGNPEDQTIN